MAKFTDWAGCYDEGWGTDITALSYSHPAKMARGLVKRIYAHLLEQGKLQPGDVVVDPFAGIGGTALDAITNGLSWVGVELEARFVDLGAGCDCTGISKADWIRFYGRWDRANYKDGRHWCPACLAQAKAAVDESPEQFSLFGPTHSATYRRNSGRIPFTAAHRYQGNIDLFHKRPEAKGRAVLLQGDSRRLADVVAQAGGVVGSPPYADGCAHTGGADPNPQRMEGSKNGAYGVDSYGTTPGQLGAMPEGRPVVVSSPPYAGISPEKNGSGINIKKQWETYRASGGGQDFDAFCRTQARHSQGYGDSAGQLGAMPEGRAIVSSPPYANDTVNSRNGIDPAKIGRHGKNSQALKMDGYGEASGQLSNLPAGDVSAVVSSPPWAGNSGGRGEASRNGIDSALFDRHQGGMVGGIGGPGNLAGLEPGEVESVIGKAVVSSPPFADSMVESGDPNYAYKFHGEQSQYGTTAGQLGTESGETFWAAAKTIVEQCAAILPPGAPAVWVVKSFVRSGEIVDFPGQWQALCEACGFETVEIVRAWLVKDKGTQIGLNGEAVRKTVKRASFFRRLHEMKNPHLSIDYEIVLFTRRV